MTTPVLHVDYERDTDRDEALKALAAAAAARLAAAWARLAAAQARLLADLGIDPQSGLLPAGRPSAAALRRVLAAFNAAVAAFDRDAAAVAEGWTARDLPIVYRDGALAALRRAGRDSGLFAWTVDHQAVLTVLTAGYWADLIHRITETVRRAQAFVRNLATALRTQAGPSATAAPEMPPLDTVIYANQARHPAASWAAAALMAQATTAANTGSLQTAVRELGCEWVQIVDGPECGWVSHEDTDHADGTLRTIDAAAAYPIAHPGCVREMVPRPDLTGRTDLQEGQAA